MFVRVNKVLLSVLEIPGDLFYQSIQSQNSALFFNRVKQVVLSSLFEIPGDLF